MAASAKGKRSKGVTTAVQIGGYSAPSVPTGVYVTGLTAANTSGAATTASAYVFDGTNTYYLCQNASLPAGGTLVICDNGNRVALNSGDAVFGQAANSCDFVLSVLEIS